MLEKTVVMRLLVVLCLLFPAWWLVACDGREPRGGLEDLPVDEVVVTFHPTAYFAGRILGGAHPLRNILPEGADPAFWRPGRSEIESLRRSSLIVLNGAALEKWVTTAALPPSRVVDASQDLSDRLLKFPTLTHSHGAGGAHTHEGTDPHVWLDPGLAALQARAIARALARTWPEEALAFERRLDELEADLLDLGRRLRELDLPAWKRPLLASHPAYDYLARALGFTIVDFGFDPEEPLDAAALAQIEERGGRGGILLWEAEPLPVTRQALMRSLGIDCVVFEPAENVGKDAQGEGRDYLSIMRANVERLAAVRH